MENPTPLATEGRIQNSEEFRTNWDVIFSKGKSTVPVRIHKGSGCYNVVDVTNDNVIETDFSTPEKATAWAVSRFISIEVPPWR